MKRIRIGKDILVRWHIATNGEALSLEGEELRLVIEDGFGHKEEHPFEVSGNMLVFTFAGTEQKRTGTYTLTLWRNYGKRGQTALDWCNAFTLVSRTCAEDECGGLEDETLNLCRSNMEVITGGGIISRTVRFLETLTQEEYDALPEKDPATMYVIYET